MQRVQVPGAEIEYRVDGDGEPVLMVHGAVLADALDPLAQERALAGRFRLVRYHRVGHLGSARPAGPVEIRDQAAHAVALVRSLGDDRVHVVGHSLGAIIALQMAHDAPEVVATIALLEMPDLTVPSAPDFGEHVLGPAFGRFASGDRAGALDSFLGGVCGPDDWAEVKRSLPAGAWDRAVADADTFFTGEAAAVQGWTSDDAAVGIEQPALVVLGGRSPEVHRLYTEVHEKLLKVLPHAESHVVPGAGHMLMQQNPGDLAAAIADFLGRHPLAPDAAAGA